jgi:CsoR family transcriptional regulator, copper-sensing transcriptional repressor
MLHGENKEQVRRRLQRIAGQVAGIQRMVDDERYCVDVLLQIAAVQAALGQVGKLVLGSHVDTCVAEAIAGGDQRDARVKVDELREVFSRFGAFRQR